MRINTIKNKVVIVFVVIWLLMFFAPIILSTMVSGVEFAVEYFEKKNEEKSFSIITTYENKDFEKDFKKYARKNKIDLNITYAKDLEIIEKINAGEEYDAVWISNSIWLYMLNDSSIIKNSKSISINPVVFGIKKSVAKELGFIDNEVYNKDIIDAIRYKNLKYVMPSVTKTNAGATAYLGFLNVLSKSEGILKLEDLDNASMQSELKSLFSGVERVSGSEDFLEEMFLKSDQYEAVVSSETSLIRINQQLEESGKEPLYLIYPKDGVAINDFPFAYIDRKQGKEEKFDILQKFLLSDEGSKKLEELGRRVWYGGINKEADKDVFNKEWGIDTTKYLMSLRYPSKAVIDKSFRLYVESFRKPSIVVFCLDFSGSMYGDGITQLRNAMNYIMDYEQASKDLIQFTSTDQVYIIPFASNPKPSIGGYYNTSKDIILRQLRTMNPSGGTNIYDSTISALKLIDEKVGKDNDQYTKTVILMTDGYSNSGTFNALRNHYKTYKYNIPVYSIMFGSSSREQLSEIADLTNAKIFDGELDLKEAFKEVRGFN